MPDIFMFEHGHNDYSDYISGGGMNDVNGGMSTFVGAMSAYIEMIFSANPQAKIVIVSHYANDSVKTQAIFNAQKTVSDINKLPFFDVADVIGWSQMHVTTTGYWDNGYWIESGGESRSITRKAQCIADGLHPHSDKSGNAIMREASILADNLLSNVKFLKG